jgi:hypothetical protein
MRKKLLLTGVAALFLAMGAAHATEYQGKLPTPVQKLPEYPPVVCVAPNWATEPCENRQPKMLLSLPSWIPPYEQQQFKFKPKPKPKPKPTDFTTVPILDESR